MWCPQPLALPYTAMKFFYTFVFTQGIHLPPTLDGFLKENQLIIYTIMLIFFWNITQYPKMLTGKNLFCHQVIIIIIIIIIITS